jgi:hypothetical protein
MPPSPALVDISLDIHISPLGTLSTEVQARLNQTW